MQMHRWPLAPGRSPGRLTICESAGSALKSLAYENCIFPLVHARHQHRPSGGTVPVASSTRSAFPEITSMDYGPRRLEEIPPAQPLVRCPREGAFHPVTTSAVSSLRSSQLRGNAFELVDLPMNQKSRISPRRRV